MTVDWNMMKTAKQNPMSFFCDHYSWESDWYHSMACLAVLSGGKKTDVHL